MDQADSVSGVARKSAARRSLVGAQRSVLDLTTALQQAITGTAGGQQPTVVWSDRGSELILYVGKLQVQIVDTMIIVAIDTESVEYGIAPLIVRFVFGGADDPASLVAATDDRALGHPMVAQRWGELFRDVVWAGIVRLAVVEAQQRGLRPTGIRLSGDRLQFRHERAVPVTELARP